MCGTFEDAERIGAHLQVPYRGFYPSLQDANINAKNMNRSPERRDLSANRMSPVYERMAAAVLWSRIFEISHTYAAQLPSNDSCCSCHVAL